MANVALKIINTYKKITQAYVSRKCYVNLGKNFKFQRNTNPIKILRFLFVV